MALPHHSGSLGAAEESDERKLMSELWRACAGPTVELPKLGEGVYYFPQGHMEQLEATTSQEFGLQSTMFNLPSKILCRVVNFELLAERDTDDLYARITLSLGSRGNEPQVPDPETPEPPRPTVHSFCKVLTPSDTSTHGGFSVLRKHANECMPPLDMTQDTPSQELIASDLHGNEWRFKHVYRGQPKRHLLTTGWSTFVASKRLVAGDVFVFLRGENGELRVGCRRLVHQQSSVPLSVLSSQSMHLGLLATASYAINTDGLFLVCYKPRASPFLIGLNKYLKAVNNELSVSNNRFKMRFVSEDSPERWFTGSIVGVEDISPHWPDSKWRCLRVHWDEPAVIQRPERVSPWEIEPLSSSPSPTLMQPAARMKRPLPVPAYEPVNSAPSPFLYRGSTTSTGFNQGDQANESISSGSQVIWPSRKKDCFTNLGNRSYSTEGFWPSLPKMNIASNSSADATEKGKNIPGSSFSPVTKPETVTGCRLFGITLRSNNTLSSPGKELQVSNLATSSAVGATPEVPEVILVEKPESSKYATEQFQVSQSQKDEKAKNSNHSYTRTRTKVQMQGVAVGRAIDLSSLGGYDELLNELEKMFEISGELQSGKNWAVVFTDDEGDMMLVGDDPWLEFRKMARKIFIYSSEEVKKMSPRGKLPKSSEDKAAEPL